MSAFSELNLIKKLSDLNSSQQSIQTLSLWLIHHRKHASVVVDVWIKELLQASLSKKLTFIYLANDVLQNAKKKGPEFIKAFVSVLPQAFEHTASVADAKMLQSLLRLLQIWSERGVLDEVSMARLRAAVPGREPVAKKQRMSAPSQNAEPATTPPLNSSPQQQQATSSPPDAAAHQPLPEPEELAKLIMDLERSASSDADVRQRIAALPPEVSDVTQVDKIKDIAGASKLSAVVDEACTLLSDYNGRLAAETADRQKLSAWLASFMAGQRAELARSEKRLEEFKQRLDQVTYVRQELKNHIQNLPDFTLLPDPLAGGLAPLPSAGDLFSI